MSRNTATESPPLVAHRSARQLARPAPEPPPFALSPADIRALERQRAWSHWLAAPAHALIALVGWLRFRTSLRQTRAAMGELREALRAHDGPLIWVANHCTLLDPVILFYGLSSPALLLTERGRRRLPWHVVEQSNYWNTITFWRLLMTRRALRPDFLEHYRQRPANAWGFRALLHALRTLPIRRSGVAPDHPFHPSKLLDRCAHLLRQGDSVFVFPEGTRPRSGWLDDRCRNAFVGLLAQRVPDAAFLCLYLRGERQRTFGNVLAVSERFRVGFRIHRPDTQASASAITTDVMRTLGELQDAWFDDSPMWRCCGGNDVIDIARSPVADHFDGHRPPDERWLGRHLTDAERARYDATAPDAHRAFLRLLAAKEAAYKALAQAEIHTPDGGWTLLDVDLFNRRVTHLPTGTRVEVVLDRDDDQLIHALAVLRGGRLGDDHEPGDVLAAVEPRDDTIDPSTAARDLLRRLIASHHDDIHDPSELTIAPDPRDGRIPRVHWRGQPQDWGVSLSHSGRFVACSLIAR